ncbi:hypothetical protein BDV18DRAFT_155265 [Aspergillus unguis]
MPPPPKPPSSASTTEVPTVQTLNPSKRSISYNLASDPPSPTHAPTNKVDPAGADNMMKASLTGLLNSREVKHEARERKVQDMLMDTQRDLKAKRRASLRKSIPEGESRASVEMKGEK